MFSRFLNFTSSSIGTFNVIILKYALCISNINIMDFQNSLSVIHKETVVSIKFIKISLLGSLLSKIYKDILGCFINYKEHLLC